MASQDSLSQRRNGNCIVPKRKDSIAMIKPIETYYNGYRFRSRLEARWAVFFDSLGIKYEYEPEGLSINGKNYLPDFYLPESKQFFEVKGVMSAEDNEKIEALIAAGYSVTVGMDGGKFYSCDKWGPHNYDLNPNYESWLCRCHYCGKYWFMSIQGSFECQCCGAHDGDGHFDAVMKYYADYTGRFETFNKLDIWNVAKQARFEHGNVPNTTLMSATVR